MSRIAIIYGNHGYISVNMYNVCMIIMVTFVNTSTCTLPLKAVDQIHPVSVVVVF